MDIQTIGHFSEPVHVAVLENGFTLIHIERKSEFVTASIAIAGGSMDDETPGEAHFLEHLVFGGSHRGGQHPKITDFSNRFGLRDSDAGTCWNGTHYEGRSWRRYARELVTMLTNVVFHPEIHEEAVAKEIGVIQSEIRRSQAHRDFAQRTLEIGIPNHKEFHHSPAGYIDSVASMTPEALWEAHRRLYTKHRSALVVSGDLSIKDMADWISPIIEAIPSGKPGDRQRQSLNEPDAFGIFMLRHETVQSPSFYILGGGTETGVERVKAVIKNKFFASFDYGALYRELRHKSSLVYALSMPFGGWPHNYQVIKIDGIRKEDMELVLERTISILNGVDLTTFDPERVEWIKNDFLMNEMERFEGWVNRHGIISLWEQDSLFTTSPKEYMQAVNAITPQELVELHRAHWNPERLCIIRMEPI